MLSAALEEAMRQNPFIAFSINRGMLTHGVATLLDYLKALAPYTAEPPACHPLTVRHGCEIQGRVMAG